MGGKSTEDLAPRSCAFALSRLEPALVRVDSRRLSMAMRAAPWGSCFSAVRTPFSSRPAEDTLRPAPATERSALTCSETPGTIAAGSVHQAPSVDWAWEKSAEARLRSPTAAPLLSSWTATMAFDNSATPFSSECLLNNAARAADAASPRITTTTAAPASFHGLCLWRREWRSGLVSRRRSGGPRVLVRRSGGAADTRHLGRRFLGPARPPAPFQHPSGQSRPQHS